MVGAFLWGKGGGVVLKKTCTCGVVIGYNETRCKDCANRKKKDTSTYDRQKRDKDSNVFYHGKAWIKIRAYIMAKYKGLCIYSLLVLGEIVPADVVHHIIELREDRGKGLDEDNLIPLCHEVHNRLHVDYTNKERAMLVGLIREWQEKYG